MNSLWDLLHAIKQLEEPRETRHTGEKNLVRRLYLNEIMKEYSMHLCKIQGYELPLELASRH